MAIEPADIEYGLSLLKARQEKDRLFRSYYDGAFRMDFVPSEARSSMKRLLRNVGYNRCRGVVNALADRTTVTGWDTLGDGTDEAIVAKSEDIWRRNRMANRQNEVIKEAFRSGDGYLIVWPNDDGNACLYPNPAHTVTVVYDDEYPDHIDYAVKCWQELRGPNKGKWRITTYDTRSVDRYITTGRTDEYPVKASRLVPYTHDGEAAAPNPYGIVPVIHFANEGDTGSFGTSELADVVGLQDGLNNSLVNMVYGEEFVSYPQKYVSGIEPNEDPVTGVQSAPFRSGVDKVWYATDALTKFGQFDPGDMTQFILVQDAWDAKIARVSSVPMHWLNQTGGLANASGEALKTAEAPFVSKVKDRQLGFSDSWAAAMHLALIIEGDAPKTVEALEPVWMNPESRSDLDFWTTAALKKASGIPEQKIWAEYGYSQDEIDEMLAMNEADAQKQAEQFARSFDRGDVGNEQDETEEDAP